MNENSEPDTRPPDWRAIAAALAWSLTTGNGHTDAEQEALDRYDAAVVWENRPLRGWRGGEPR